MMPESEKEAPSSVGPWMGSLNLRHWSRSGWFSPCHRCRTPVSTFLLCGSSLQILSPSYISNGYTHRMIGQPATFVAASVCLRREADSNWRLSS